MATLHIDLKNTGGRYTAKGWEEVQREATVTGLSGDADAIINAALAELPSIGDAHPDAGMGDAKLISIDITGVGANVVNATLIYGIQGYENDYIEGGSSVEQVETTRDYAGNTMSVTYAGEDTGDVDTDQIATVSVYKPKTTVTITRSESASPASKARSNVGKVNNGGWTGIDPSASARTWLLTGISYRSSDGGNTWEVVYTAEYNPNTWDVVYAYRNPQTGYVPNDIDDDESATGTFQVYETVDFDTLW